MNENGQRLLHNNLCTKHFLQHKTPTQGILETPYRAKHWHQLDLVLTRGNPQLPNADCDTDHSLECSKVKLQPRRVHRSKKAGQPRIDTNKTHNFEIVEAFVQVHKDVLPRVPNFDVSGRWEHLRDAVYNAIGSARG